MKRSNILLLTSTIAPRPDTHALVRSDPDLRLQDYLRSLEFYLQQLADGVFDTLVYVDNSGHSLASLAELAQKKGVFAQCEFISYESDMPAQYDQVQIDGKTLYRVRVGPEVDFKTAERMAGQIKDKFKLKPRVMRYPE